jgi:hypothetical protein
MTAEHFRTAVDNPLHHFPVLRGNRVRRQKLPTMLTKDVSQLGFTLLFPSPTL